MQECDDQSLQERLFWRLELENLRLSNLKAEVSDRPPPAKMQEDLGR
jgi:hypothetical protein